MTAVTLSTIRVSTYNNVKTFIKNNKSASWTVLASFPETNPVFPCIIINPVNVSYDVKGMTRNIWIPSMEILVEFYAPSTTGKGKDTVDAEIDKITYAFKTGFQTLREQGLILDSDTPILDGTTDSLEFNENKLNYGSFILRLKDP